MNKIYEKNRKHYLKNRNRIIKEHRAWHEENKEKHNQQKREYYQKNKKIWHKYYQDNKEKVASRVLTYRMEINNLIKLKKECKNCSSKIDLEMHHEIYPITEIDIIRAVKEEKIYILCKDCHDKHRRII